MDLPNEIIKEICCRPELERDDLRALRLTSKTLCEFASDAFAHRCFEKITVLIARSSLRTFIDLSHHPRFGPAVKQVNVSPKSIVRSCHWHQPVTYQTFSGDPKVLRNFLNRSHEELELTDGIHVEPMLSAAFKAFAQRQQSIGLQFLDDESNPIGARNLMTDKTSHVNWLWHSDWKTTFERTMRAVFSQDCKITDLLLDQQDNYHSCVDIGLCTDGVENLLSSVFSQLSSLEITFHHEDIELTAQSIKRIVSASKVLKHLHMWDMGAIEYSIGEYLPNILRNVVSTSLETITFAMTHITEPELLAFLSRHRGTLRELRMVEASRLVGSCMSLMAWIKDNLHSLKYLELNQVCDSHNAPSWDHREAKSYWVTHDEDMQACLADILNGKPTHKYTVELTRYIPTGVMVKEA